MREDEFSEALVALEPPELNQDQEAWAEYWYHTKDAEEHWNRNVKEGFKIGLALMVLGAPLILIALLLSSASPAGAFATIAWWASILMGGTVGGFGGLILFIAGEETVKHIGYKRRIPELPNGYVEEMGELSHTLRGKIARQKKFLSEAAFTPQIKSQIDVGHAQLSSYQLAVGKGVEELAMSDELALLE